MESGIVNKNEEKLTRQLKDLEARYQRLQTSNPREEGAVVREIETLKRNLLKLAYVFIFMRISLQEIQCRERRTQDDRVEIQRLSRTS